MPGPVEGKGEVNSPEMQVGTGLILARHVYGGYGGFEGLRPTADLKEPEGFKVFAMLDDCFLYSRTSVYSYPGLKQSGQTGGKFT